MRRYKGLTLIELMISMVAALIIFSGLGIIMADGQRGFATMYEKAHADVVEEGFVLKNRFDSIIRKASPKNAEIGSNNEYIKVSYYSGPLSENYDRYAKFYFDDSGDGVIKLVEGDIPESGDVSTHLVCSNVTSCHFEINGRTASMVVTLEDNEQKNIISSSAFMHN